MLAITTVAVGLLITVAVEDKPVDERPNRRAVVMASRTVPPGAALLLALVGVVLNGHLTDTAANVIGWFAFSFTAAGALSVIFTAINDAFRARRTAAGELATELKLLVELHASGYLTAEEFDVAKRKLLGT